MKKTGQKNDKSQQIHTLTHTLTHTHTHTHTNWLLTQIFVQIMFLFLGFLFRLCLKSNKNIYSAVFFMLPWFCYSGNVTIETFQIGNFT